MTEYHASTPLTPESHRFGQLNTALYEAGQVRRALQSSIENFQASLDQEHEVAIRVAPCGAQGELHAAEVRFAPANLVVFQGYSVTGEPLHLVQHLSQVNFTLVAARKVHEAPLRVAFVHAAERDRGSV
ncbi:DUF6173 family protein [Geomonas sp. RF6]|uniref:DUF6173 family protein n=1 Tax=Geomonas sp. RF6 TaxID=2897342 RepID=UPI001E341A13|nr:DUF6173 family protein [Geomonas sp. RF6]UFS69286.1 DUF6173 family protein [Geomonas sp. RF6]